MKSISRTQDIIEEYGSRYRAIHGVSQKARQLRQSCYNVILDSQAVEWAISGIPPENLNELVRSRAEREAGMRSQDHLTKVLDSIDEENIREAVKNSYKLSVKKKQIWYDYNGIKDKGIRTRIRVLTKMAFFQKK